MHFYTNITHPWLPHLIIDNKPSNRSYRGPEIFIDTSNTKCKNLGTIHFFFMTGKKIVKKIYENRNKYFNYY